MEEIVDTKNRELRVTRMLDAPLDIVWKVWTNPEDIAQWWGPNGFTNTTYKMDVVANGEWLLTMHGADGKRFPNKSVFIEIVPQKKIVFRHFNPNYLATIIFDQMDSKSFLDWTMVFDTDELFKIVVNTFKADEGLIQNVDKLERYLARR